MTDAHLFAKICQHIMGIEHPVELRIAKVLPDTLGLEDADGGYLPMDGYHLIMVRIEATRGFYEVLAHELVHAYCEEQHPQAKTHGHTFKRACAKLRKMLKSQADISLNPLYLKGVDK